MCWRYHLSFGPGYRENRSSLHVWTEMHYSKMKTQQICCINMFCVSSPRLVVHKTKENIMHTQDHLHTHLCKLLKAIQRASQISEHQWEVCTSHITSCRKIQTTLLSYLIDLSDTLSDNLNTRIWEINNQKDKVLYNGSVKHPYTTELMNSSGMNHFEMCWYWIIINLLFWAVFYSLYMCFYREAHYNFSESVEWDLLYLLCTLWLHLYKLLETPLYLHNPCWTVKRMRKIHIWNRKMKKNNTIINKKFNES